MDNKFILEPAFVLHLKKFKETNEEFIELARIDNLVNHDSIDHPDEDKRTFMRNRVGHKGHALGVRDDLLSLIHI